MQGNSRTPRHRFVAVTTLALSLICSVLCATPAQARTASSDVKAKVGVLLTSYVPNVTETKVTTSARTYTHPGIGVSKPLLDNMRDRVRAGDEPWASAFVQFSAIGSAQTAPLMRIFSDTARDYVNIPAGGQSTDGYHIVRNMAQDAHTAWAQTIMWYVTGRELYRQNAMNLIRQWSKVQSIGAIYDEQIRVSLAVYQFAYAAEILRSSPSNTTAYNWTASDDAGFLSYLAIMKSKYDRYTHFMNQHGMCAMATLAAAIFTNHDTDYAHAVQRATTNPELGTNYDFSVPTNPQNRNGSILAQIREVSKNAATGATVPANIQVVEMGRDQGHPYVSVGALSAIAMTTYLQGTKVDPVLGTISSAANSVNLFNFMNHRLLFGANYLTSYNLGNAVTYVPTFMSADGQFYSAPTTTDRGTIQTTLAILYNYYKFIEKRADMETGASTRYLAEAFSRIYPEGDSQDFAGHGVLMYTLDDSANLARFAALSASSSLSSSSWGTAKAADGRAASESFSLGWSSANSTTVNHAEWLKFDFGSARPINRVELYPRSDGVNGGQGFPVDFSIDASTDNINWTSVVTRTGQALPSGVQRFDFPFQSARYVRVQGTSLRANPNDGNLYRMQLAEVRLFGGYASTGAGVASSTSLENADWARTRSVDGRHVTLAGNKGWSSAPGASATVEFLTLDLGASKYFGHVNLYPRNDGVHAGYGYPIDFTIDTSADGVSWTTAIGKSGIGLPPGGAVQAFSFGQRPARYVRVRGTTQRANPNDSNYHRMQLSEMEVY